MNSHEHYTESVAFLATARDAEDLDEQRYALAAAQVHATLALVLVEARAANANASTEGGES